MPRFILFASFCAPVMAAMCCTSGAFAAKPERKPKPATLNKVTKPLVAVADRTKAEGLVISALAQAAIGNDERRNIYLRQALEKNPESEQAHWHLGDLSIDGKWLSIDEAIEENADDDRFYEYRNRRMSVNGESEGQLVLAEWCESIGLDDAARAHLLNAQSRYDRWSKPAGKELLAFEAKLLKSLHPRCTPRNNMVVESKEKLVRAWRPRVVPILRRINDPSEYDSARTELAQIATVEAIPAMEHFISKSSERGATAVVQVVKQINHPEASRSLARHAFSSRWNSARILATNALRDRPMNEWVPLLLSRLTFPVRTHTEVYNVGGSVRTMSVLMQEGPVIDAIHVRRSGPTFWTAPAIDFSAQPTSAGSFDRSLQTETVTGMAYQSRGSEDRIAAFNRPITNVLVAATDAFNSADDPRPAEDARRWWSWWAHEIDAYYPPDNTDYRQTVIASCFVADTTVWTATGPMPIDRVEIGDCVLAQDVETGELAFKPVLATTVRPETNLLTIHAGGKTITGTRGHPFWVLGEGWKMSKHLKAGDRLHTPNGSLQITKIEEAPLEKAYNLVVADFNTYFVGEQRLLVHDNTLWQPTLAVVPGLVAKAEVKPR